MVQRESNEQDIEIDAANIAEEIKQATQESITEEDLRVRVENILRTRVCEPLGIPWARYERTTVVSRMRSDALYGKVILEYEKPNKFKTLSGYEKAVEQLKNYIAEEAEQARAPLNLFFGVALDGFKIGFVRYVVRLKNWDVQKPIAVNGYSVLKLIEAIRGLARKPLDADFLIKDLGPGSKVAKDTVSVLYKRITNTKTQRSRMLFNDWRRVFSQVCAYSAEKIKGLEEIYGIERDNIDFEALLFAVHTYYALVMKLLAAEVAVLFGGFFLKSYTRRLERAYLKSVESLWSELKELEEGGIFVNLGIENFLEADYFAWYLDEWESKVANAVIGVVKKLSEYEPATAELEPDVIRDLFKNLYQNLVPRKIRHDLGEFYTPDWLAELVLDEVGFTVENFEKIAEKDGVEAPLDLRLLDPACGSGTFLVLAIKRVKEYAKEHFLEQKALGKIAKNIVGFDLNPLAVLATRTNYLLALGELIRVATTHIELPVYFADSILAERRSTFAGVEYALKTTVGTFSVPVAIVNKRILGNALSLIEECVHRGYSRGEFKERASIELKVLDESEISALTNLYTQMLKLEKAGKNKIWTRVMKNSFAPLFAGKFDYVAGNPPWVNWESLPREYRSVAAPMWAKYGLQARATSKQFELGKMGRDISYLFTYVCSHRYLDTKGKLGFLITWAAFKSRAAEVFRNFCLPGQIPLKVLKVHDLVRLKPFEGANNLTSFIILEKGGLTKYPVPYVLWRDYDRQDLLVAKPSHPLRKTSPWMIAKKQTFKTIEKVRGVSDYTASKGVSTSANGIYWIEILEIEGENYLVQNLNEAGKKKYKKVITRVESDFVRPLVRGRKFGKWFSEVSNYIVLPHTKLTGWKAIGEKELKVKFPLTHGYFYAFRDKLLKRALYNKLRKGHPFYIVTNIHKKSFSKYKVAWKRMGNVFNAAVIGPLIDKYVGKCVPMLHEGLVFVPTKSEDEAHYLCALLNSAIINFAILSATEVGGKSLAPPSVISHLKLNRFSSKNRLHQRLAEFSKKAHKLAKEEDSKALAEIQDEIDTIVARLYGLSIKELESLKKQSEK